MVVKIQPAAKSVSNAMDYNERKMSSPEGVLDAEKAMEYLDGENTGHILATMNVPEDTTLENEFNRLRLKNERSTKGRKLENPAFHMSINPGARDIPMDEQTVIAFTKELMDRLGYVDNPYRIYRHDDTGRTHYHVVSTRIAQDGKKVKDAFENSRCESICKELAVKYGFVYGLQDAEEKEIGLTNGQDVNGVASGPKGPEIPQRPVPKEDVPSGNGKREKEAKNDEAEKKRFVPPFELGDTPAVDQYRVIHNEAMTWWFTTPEQYAALLRWRFNVAVKYYNNKLYYVGLDKKFDGCTPIMSESEVGMNALDDVLQRCADTNIKKRRSQRERLEKLADWAADNSEDWTQYRKLLQKKGVYLSVSWSEKGEPFGITWIDRGTKCIWKGSETDVDLTWLKVRCEARGWTMKPHKKDEGKFVLRTALKTSIAKALNLPEDAAGPYSGNLSSISTADALKKLLQTHGINKSQRSNADASKNGRHLKYGEEDNKIDIII